MDRDQSSLEADSSDLEQLEGNVDTRQLQDAAAFVDINKEESNLYEKRYNLRAVKRQKLEDELVVDDTLDREFAQVYPKEPGWFMNINATRKVIEQIAKKHQLTLVQATSIAQFMNQAANEFLTCVLNPSVKAAQHRSNQSLTIQYIYQKKLEEYAADNSRQKPKPPNQNYHNPDTWNFQVKPGVNYKKQLAAIAKIDKEMTKKVMPDISSKKKEKRPNLDGTMTKKDYANLPEEYKKKLTDKTALAAAGARQLSWMTEGEEKKKEKGSGRVYQLTPRDVLFGLDMVIRDYPAAKSLVVPRRYWPEPSLTLHTKSMDISQLPDNDRKYSDLYWTNGVFGSHSQ
eukprot:NODE_152_length_16986_cov_0.478119.p7 type:complete len:343 gc:universal NODE_152_length_16986_cov_0.478119:6649-5621(-)